MRTEADRSGKRRARAMGACLVAAAVAAALPSAGAAAATPLGTPQRVSFSGGDANPDIGGYTPAIAANPRTGESLVAWTRSGPGNSTVTARLIDARGTPLAPEVPVSQIGVPAGDPAVAYDARRNEFMVAFSRVVDGSGEWEIYVRRLTAAGTPVGAEERVSQMGADGDPSRNAYSPAIAYNPLRGEYLVAWSGQDQGSTEFEIHAQRVTGEGAQVGPDDLRVSDMGPDGDTGFSADQPDVAYDERHDEYLVVWEGEDDTPPQVAGESEIHVQRITGDGAETGADDARISLIGAAGDPSYQSDQPAVAYNPATDEFLVAWRADDDDPATASEFEIHSQRLTHEGLEIGADDRRISTSGPWNDTSLTGQPAVAVDLRANEYLVTWRGTDPSVTPNSKTEVMGQRLSAAGDELDGDVRISRMPAEDSPEAGARYPAITYDSRTGQYLAAWTGSTSVPPPVPGKEEVYAQRVSGGVAVAAASAQCRSLPPVAASTPGDPSKVVLTTGQMLINQRISQAAVRRANGVEAWLGHGLESRDLCQASLGAEELPAGSVLGYTAVPFAYGPPDPRPVAVAAAKPGDPSSVTLTVGQMLINQRISQAAVRRLNALKARLDAGLTGGDVIDGQVGRAQMLATTSVLFTPVVPPPAASTTQVAPATPGDPSKVTLSAGQMLINQRISQAAVRRANDLVRRLDDGIGADEIRDATLTVADLAPGLALSTTP